MTVTNTMQLDASGQWVEFTDVVVGGARRRGAHGTEIGVRKSVVGAAIRR